jgi:uncharacterized protein
VHQDGLVHVSQLADRFVKDPHEVVKAGDVVKVRVTEVDIPRKRIGLTMRKDGGGRDDQPRRDGAAKPGGRPGPGGPKGPKGPGGPKGQPPRGKGPQGGGNPASGGTGALGDALMAAMRKK